MPMATRSISVRLSSTGPLMALLLSTCWTSAGRGVDATHCATFSTDHSFNLNGKAVLSGRTYLSEASSHVPKFSCKSNGEMPTIGWCFTVLLTSGLTDHCATDVVAVVPTEAVPSVLIGTNIGVSRVVGASVRSVRSVRSVAMGSLSPNDTQSRP